MRKGDCAVHDIEGRQTPLMPNVSHPKPLGNVLISATAQQTHDDGVDLQEVNSFMEMMWLWPRP